MQPCHCLLASAGLIPSLIHNQNPSIHMKNHTETPRCLTGMNFGISVVSDIHKITHGNPVPPRNHLPY